MPAFVPPQRARFALRAGTPVVHLDTDVPTVTDAGRWYLLSRCTLCVVDGPEGAGYLIARRLPDGTDAAPPGWDDAVRLAGGTMVVFGDATSGCSIFVRLVATDGESTR